MGGKSRPHRDSITDRPARSQLSYRAHMEEYAGDLNIDKSRIPLSGIIRMESHPDMRQIRITGFFFANRLHF